MSRLPKWPELIAVSKNQPVEKIRQAVDCGQRIFGENRVQEAAEKFPALRAEFPDIELHLIGPLQTNKVRDALKIFDVIQTLDREKLAVVIAKEDVSKTKRFMIQVNIGEEPQKAGIAPQEAAAFYQFCKNELALNVFGLMCIPPVGEPAFLYFGLLRNLAKSCGDLKLSMGMSGDYEEAVRMEADYVRVGSAIFGER